MPRSGEYSAARVTRLRARPTMIALLIVGIAFVACFPYVPFGLTVMHLGYHVNRKQRWQRGGSLRRYARATREYLNEFGARYIAGWAAFAVTIVALLSLFGLTCGYVRLSVEWRWEEWLFFCVGVNAIVVTLRYEVLRRSVDSRSENHDDVVVEELGYVALQVALLFVLSSLTIGIESYRRDHGPLDGSEPQTTETITVASVLQAMEMKNEFILVSAEGERYLVSTTGLGKSGTVLEKDRVTVTYWVNRDPNANHPYRYVTDIKRLEPAN